MEWHKKKTRLKMFLLDANNERMLNFVANQKIDKSEELLINYGPGWLKDRGLQGGGTIRPPQLFWKTR